MTMCDKEHYDDLEERVSGLETRLVQVETSITDLRDECKGAFGRLETELRRIYDERLKWGEWARENIGRALKWAGVIVLSACGINEASTIIKSVAALFGCGQ